MVRRFQIFAVVAVSAAVVSAAAAAQQKPPTHAEAQGGLPLSYYCSHVPELTVNRPHAVDDWVRICTVYFNARPHPPDSQAAPNQSESPPQ